MKAGHFIVFEGPEGGGKSTQARLLADWLRQRGQIVLESREPGGSSVGEQIRQILLDPDNHAMLAETEALLYAAARAQHVGEVLRPALAQGMVVVCDRFVDSSLAYQGGGRGLPMAELLAVQRFATGGLIPELRVLLDLPADEGLRRRRQAGDEFNRLDAADLAFHRRVREAYHQLVGSNPQEWIVIDATRPVDSVHREVTKAVTERFGDRLGTLAAAEPPGQER
jgi:dTMP kinase